MPDVRLASYCCSPVATLSSNTEKENWAGLGCQKQLPSCRLMASYSATFLFWPWGLNPRPCTRDFSERIVCFCGAGFGLIENSNHRQARSPVNSCLDSTLSVTFEKTEESVIRLMLSEPPRGRRTHRQDLTQGLRGGRPGHRPDGAPGVKIRPEGVGAEIQCRGGDHVSGLMEGSLRQGLEVN